MFVPRFTLRSLLAAVTVVALALASLLEPWRAWRPAIVFTAVLVLMLVSIPVSLFARGRVRAFYSGFAIVGWGYFLLAYVPWFDANIGHQLLARPMGESICFAVTGSLGDLPQFINVTHSLFMFTVAYCGGVVTSAYCADSDTRSA